MNSNKKQLIYDPTLYKKEGRKYIPVHDSDAYRGLDNGCWLVTVDRGCTSIRKAIEPATAAIQFATLMATNKISKYLLEASAARPQKRQYSKKQMKILKQLQDLPENEKLMYWEYDSLQGMAEKIVDLILENYNINNK